VLAKENLYKFALEKQSFALIQRYTFIDPKPKLVLQKDFKNDPVAKNIYKILYFYLRKSLKTKKCKFGSHMKVRYVYISQYFETG